MKDSDLTAKAINAIGNIVNTAIASIEINLITLEALGNHPTRNYVLNGLKQTTSELLKKIDEVEESIDDSFRLQSEELLNNSATARDSLAKLQKETGNGDLRLFSKMASEGHGQLVKSLGAVETAAINEVSQYFAPFRKKVEVLIVKLGSLPYYR